MVFLEGHYSRYMPFERRVGHKRLSVTRSWTMDTNILKIAGQIIIISDHFNKS